MKKYTVTYYVSLGEDRNWCNEDCGKISFHKGGEKSFTDIKLLSEYYYDKKDKYGDVEIHDDKNNYVHINDIVSTDIKSHY